MITNEHIVAKILADVRILKAVAARLDALEANAPQPIVTVAEFAEFSEYVRERLDDIERRVVFGGDE